MPWQDNSGNGSGPWGQPPRGGGPRRPANGQPDLEELLRQGRRRFRRVFPGRGGPGGGGGLSRGALGLIALVILGLYFAGGFYQVGTAELAVVTRFGEYNRVEGPGLKWHVPWPVETAKTELVDEFREVEAGAATSSNSDAGLMLTGDKNFVNIDFVVQYNIKPERLPLDGEDLPPVAQYVYLIDDPQNLVRTIAESAIREVVGRLNLEPIISTDRETVRIETARLMQEALDSYKSGIQVLNVNIREAGPPAQVIEAFRDVENADQDRQTRENQAARYRNEVIPRARGEAAQLVQQSEAYKSRVVAEARGEAQRFVSIYTEYAQAPDVTRRRMYLETVESVLGDMNKIVVDQNGQSGVVPYLPLNELGRATGRSQNN